MSIFREHKAKGGFDSCRLPRPRAAMSIVAHTANNAVDVFDAQKINLFSIPGLPRRGRRAGEATRQDLIFSSNRAENTIGIFRIRARSRSDKGGRVGIGTERALAYDHGPQAPAGRQCWRSGDRRLA